jgi:uncharacterized protein YceK
LATAHPAAYAAGSPQSVAAPPIELDFARRLCHIGRLTGGSIMRRRVTACLAVVLAFAAGGCGTIVNLNGTAGRQIYGGVKQDALSGSDHLAEAFSSSCPSFSPVPENPSLGKKLMIKSFCAGCGGCMLAVDLPVSAVADTLTLPVTIPAALKKKKDDRSRPRHPKPARVAGAPVPATSP